VNTDQARTAGKEASTNAAFFLRVDYRHPQLDVAAFHRLVKVRGMPRYEPRLESVPKTSCTSAQPIAKTFGKWTCAAANRFPMRWKR
jgi:hypothetical protein